MQVPGVGLNRSQSASGLFQLDGKGSQAIGVGVRCGSQVDVRAELRPASQSGDDEMPISVRRAMELRQSFRIDSEKISYEAAIARLSQADEALAFFTNSENDNLQDHKITQSDRDELFFSRALTLCSAIGAKDTGNASNLNPNAAYAMKPATLQNFLKVVLNSTSLDPKHKELLVRALAHTQGGPEMSESSAKEFEQAINKHASWWSSSDFRAELKKARDTNLSKLTLANNRLRVASRKGSATLSSFAEGVSAAGGKVKTGAAGAFSIVAQGTNEYLFNPIVDGASLIVEGLGTAASYVKTGISNAVDAVHRNAVLTGDDQELFSGWGNLMSKGQAVGKLGTHPDYRSLSTENVHIHAIALAAMVDHVASSTNILETDRPARIEELKNEVTKLYKARCGEKTDVSPLTTELDAFIAARGATQTYQPRNGPIDRLASVLSALIPHPVVEAADPPLNASPDVVVQQGAEQGGANPADNVAPVPRDADVIDGDGLRF